MFILKKIYGYLHSLMTPLDERGEPSGGYYESTIRRRVASMVEGIPGPLADVGCGEGLFLGILAESVRRYPVYAVDIDKEILKKTRGRLKKKGIKNVELIEASAEDLPFGDRTMDVVTLLNIVLNIETTERLKRILSELARVLKDDGVLIMDYRSSRNRLISLLYKYTRLYDGSVASVVTRSACLMADIARETGFLVEEEINASGFLPKLSPAVILKLKKIEGRKGK